MKRLHQKILPLVLTVMMVAQVFAGTAAYAADAVLTDISAHWARKYIEYGVESGYINGYTDGTFRPDQTVTRAEFSKMLNTAIGFAMTADTSFSDVDPKEWYASDVEKAYTAGYITGYTDGTFRPNQTITRQEAAVILSRIMTSPEQTARLSVFHDAAHIADWAEDGVEKVLSKGLMKGDDQGNFNPAKGLTRAEAAKIVGQLIQTETIVRENETIRAGGTYEDTIYANGAEISERLKDSTITFSNCKIFGVLLDNGADGNTIVMDDTDAAVVYLSQGSDATTVKAKGDSAIQSLTVARGAAVTQADEAKIASILLTGNALSQSMVSLTGNFEDIAVSSGSILRVDGSVTDMTVDKQIALFLQAGKIETLTVAKGADGAIINLSDSVSVKKAVLYSAVSFMGLGKIQKADQKVVGSTYQTEPDEVTGVTTETDSKLTPDVSPDKAATNVSISSNVVLTFEQTLYNDEGATLTTGYVEDVVELRRGSASGTKIDFTARVSSSKKVLTIMPDKNLEPNTTYYVVLPAGAFTTSDKKATPKFSTYFKTIQNLQPEITPEYGQKDVAVTDKIKLTFKESVYRPNGSSLTSAYLVSNAIELRKGSASGTRVDFTASVSGRVITLTPDKALERDTKYYVVLNSETIANSSGALNERFTSYFTTADTLIPVISPEDGETNVLLDSAITISFDEAVYRLSGTSLSSAYIQSSVVELRRGSSSGTKIDFTAAVSSDKKTITILPDELLSKKTKYYVIVKAESLSNANGGLNIKATASFTTADTMTPSITPSNGDSSVSASPVIKIAFNEALYSSANVAITSEYITTSGVELRKNSTTGTKLPFTATVSTDKKTITIEPISSLEVNTRYYIILPANALMNANGEKNARITSYFLTSDKLVPVLTPADGADEISVNSKITVKFDESVYRSNGNALSSAYIEDYVVEIRSGSENGTKIEFSASINTAKNTITLTPTFQLNGDTDYYVILLKDSLTNADGDFNPGSVSTFRTGTYIVKEIVFTPENKATGISVETPIVITFGSPVYRSGGGNMTASYLESSAFELRKSSSSGTKVAFSVTAISSDKRTVTLQPDETLSTNTVYYVKLLSSALQYEDGTRISATSSYFTTNSGKPRITSLTVDNVKALTADVQLTCDMDGTATIKVTSSNGELVKDLPVSVKKGEVTTVHLDGLAAETRYVVNASVKAGTLSSDIGTANFTTDKVMKVTAKTISDSAVTIAVEYTSPGMLSVAYTNVKTGETKDRLTGVSLVGAGTREVEIKGLDQNTEYAVTAEFSDEFGNTSKKTVTILTEKSSAYISLASIQVVAGETVYELPEPEYNCSATIDAATSVKIRPTAVAAAEDVEITVNGVTVKSGQLSGVISIKGDSAVVEIGVKAIGGEKISATYTLTITVIR